MPKSQFKDYVDLWRKSNKENPVDYSTVPKNTYGQPDPEYSQVAQAKNLNKTIGELGPWNNLGKRDQRIVSEQQSNSQNNLDARARGLALEEAAKDASFAQNNKTYNFDSAENRMNELAKKYKESKFDEQYSDNINTIKTEQKKQIDIAKEAEALNGKSSGLNTKLFDPDSSLQDLQTRKKFSGWGGPNEVNAGVAPGMAPEMLLQMGPDIVNKAAGETGKFLGAAKDVALQQLWNKFTGGNQ